MVNAYKLTEHATILQGGAQQSHNCERGAVEKPLVGPTAATVV